MGKLTISMAIFNSYVSHYQRVYCITHYCKRYYHSLWSLVLPNQKSGMIRINWDFFSRPIRLWNHRKRVWYMSHFRGFWTSLKQVSVADYIPNIWVMWKIRTFTLWLFNIAMENGPFIDGLPINSMVDLSMAMWQITSSNQMVPIPEEHSQFAHHFCKNTSDFWDFLAFFLIAEGYVQWEFQDPKMEVR